MEPEFGVKELLFFKGVLTSKNDKTPCHVMTERFKFKGCFALICKISAGFYAVFTGVERFIRLT